MKLDSTQRKRSTEQVASKQGQLDRTGIRSTQRANPSDGPVRLETIPGTDTFIIRGRKEDVERAMKIIQGSTESTSIREDGETP